jgi:tetratricopeptide (TPR) repeat protein
MIKRSILLLLCLLMFAAALPAFAQNDTTAQQTVPGVTAPELYARANDALQAQNFDRAVLDYSLFILLNPTLSFAYYERGYAYFSLNDYEHALEDVSQAIRTRSATETPEYNAALYTLRGDIRLQQREIEAAIEDYSQSLEFQPTTAVLFSRSQLYAATMSYEAALTDLNDAIALDGANPVFYVYRGSLNSALSDRAAAGTDYMEFFSLIQTETRSTQELRTGQGLNLPVEQGIVYSVPFKAEAGQFVSAVAVGNSQNIDPLLVLVDAEGNALAGDDDSGGDLTALLLEVPIPEDGDYMLVVGHSLRRVSGQVSLQLQIADARMTRPEAADETAPEAEATADSP